MPGDNALSTAAACGSAGAELAPGGWVRSWKQPAARRGIDIRDVRGAAVGRLVPVDAQQAADERVIAAMTRWRTQHGSTFFSQFAPTCERTGRWLQKYLADDQRLLLLICDAAGNRIGNVGLCGIQAGAAELDNVIRAEPTTVPRMGYLATRALIAWWFGEMSAGRLTLRVFSDNLRAIALYDALGFRCDAVIPVVAESLDEEIRYRPAGADQAPQAERHWLAMSLAARAWRRQACSQSGARA